MVFIPRSHLVEDHPKVVEMEVFTALILCLLILKELQ